MIPESPGRSETRLRALRWLAEAGLVAAILVAYWNCLLTPFLFDDTGAVMNNPTIRHLGSLEVLNPPADGSTTTKRPVVNVSFALNYAISGDHVWSYHALNLVIHALAALTLFGVMRRTLAGAILGPDWGGASLSLAFLTALLWALHPLLTETVVCIAQRTESLCSLFYLLTLYGFVRAAASPPGALGWYAFSVVCCLSGMATKEVMVTAPLIVLLYDRTFFAGSFAAAWRPRRGYYAGLAGTWLLLAWLALHGGTGRGVAAGFGLGVSWWHYLLQQCTAVLLYLKLSFWPHPLVLDYGTAVAHSLAEVWWQAVTVVILLAVTVRALVRHPAAGFAGAWFFIILAPSSSFVPLITQTMAEHRMYLPLAAVVAGGVLLAHRYLGPRAVWVLATAALACGGLTMARNRDYRDPIAIWSDSVANYPENPRAHNNLAWALQAQGNFAEANAHFARAIELQPSYVTAHYTWGVALLDQGRPEEAIAQFAAAVKWAPDDADAYVNLGNALMQVQRAAEAIPYYEAALQLKPAADVNYDLGVALIDADRPAEAETHLLAALRTDPQLVEADYQLGRAAEMSGHTAEAETAYAATLRLDADHLKAHRQLGLLLAQRGQLAPAAEHFRAMVRLQPADADAHANLGNILLLEGKPQEAIACYEQSLRLRPDDPRTRHNLQLAREARPH
jgi:tetratricopeptide (TPR) repeat protein